VAPPKVSNHEGKILLQDPSSCLFPDSLVKLEELQLHDAYFAVENIEDIF